MRQSPSYIWSVTPDSCVGCWLCNNLWLKVKTKKWKRQKTCHIELSICTERGWTQNIKIMGSIVVHLLCHRVNMYNIFLHLLAPKFTPVAHALMLKVNYGFPWTQHLGHCPTLHSSCDFHCSSSAEVSARTSTSMCLSQLWCGRDQSEQPKKKTKIPRRDSSSGWLWKVASQLGLDKALSCIEYDYTTSWWWVHLNDGLGL